MKILIVDDDKRMRQFLNKILEPFADEIIQYEDGIEAVKYFNQINPDWILMDIKMKKLDGISATDLILKSNPQAKIIIVTDYDDDKLKSNALKSGACSYVLKENILDVLDIIKK